MPVEKNTYVNDYAVFDTEMRDHKFLKANFHFYPADPECAAKCGSVDEQLSFFKGILFLAITVFSLNTCLYMISLFSDEVNNKWIQPVATAIGLLNMAILMFVQWWYTQNTHT